MSWLKRILPTISSKSSVGDSRKEIPEGLWAQCPACEATVYRAELTRCLDVCPKCDHHMRINARKRLNLLFDEGCSPEEIGADVEPVDKLNFRDSKKYKDRISAAQKKTNEKSALVVQKGQVHGLPLVAAVFEFGFIGGSMGSAVGERFVQGVHYALEHKIPFICFCASGGARMQEGLFSLMQMSKTSAALTKLGQAGLPYISILTDPTTGGVSASFATLGDVIIAEPNALIGFAGPRVIEQTVREVLPKGFQRSEFLLEKGAIDMIVHRRDLRDKLHSLLNKLSYAA